MDELTIGDKIYISSKAAAKLTGYAKDYVGQLCREGRVEARLVGRNWYVLEASIREHRFGKVEMGPEPSKSTDSEETASVSTWTEPEYFVETPAFIPVLSLKPEPQEEERSAVVADMQSAWHEWFVGMKGTATESETPEAPSVEETVAITSLEVEDYEQEVEEDVEQEEVLANQEPEVLVLTRIKEPDTEVATVAPDGEAPRESAVEEEPPMYRAVGGAKSSLLLKSLLVGVALVATVTAVVGTGGAKPLLTGSSFEVLQPFVLYLEGTSTYEKRI